MSVLEVVIETELNQWRTEEDQENDHVVGLQLIQEGFESDQQGHEALQMRADRFKSEKTVLEADRDFDPKQDQCPIEAVQ